MAIVADPSQTGFPRLADEEVAMRFMTLLAIAFLVVAPSAANANSWKVHVSTDQMSGETSKYLVSYSINTLRGWLQSGRILLGYSCGGNIYLRANDLGFQIDDIDCGSYSCKRLQYARVKFDSEPPESIYFDVWDGNNDGMTLIGRRNSRNARGDKEYFLRNMKSANTMLLELVLFGTKGKEQIAEFDLNGFTSAFGQCNS